MFLGGLMRWDQGVLGLSGELGSFLMAWVRVVGI